MINSDLRNIPSLKDYPLLVPFLLFLFLGFTVSVPNAQELRPSESTSDTSSLQKSRVIVVEDPSLVSRFKINGPAVSTQFNQALLALTRQRSVASAWNSLVEPKDIIGIKINTEGGSIMNSHRELVQTIIEGLKEAGIPAQNIIVWDKFQHLMIASGYVPMSPEQEWQCVSIIPGTGFDPKKFYFHEIVGQLIWGDHDFVGKTTLLMPDFSNPNSSKDPFTSILTPDEKENKDEKNQDKDKSEQISNRSYFNTLLSQKITKLINIPVMSDHEQIGVNGCLASLALGSIDNNRRFKTPSSDSALAITEIYSHELIQPKTILHVMDGLIVQFAGGPQFAPNYAESPGLLILSQDPVAIDTLVRERLEQMRKERKVVPIGDKALHIDQAASFGLGTNQKEQMKIILSQ